jgi:CelD/BcsL family acetyltransferase involved in cellulose biosynthesis
MTDSPDASSSLVIADLAADDPAWRRLTHSAVGATPVHHPFISQVAALTSGCHLSALGAWREGQLVGGVAVVVDEHNDVWPRSLAPYNGPLVMPMPEANPTTRHRHEAMVAGALLDELAARHRSVTLRLRPRSIDVRKIVQSGWNLTSTFTYEVPVADPDRAWRNIDDNRRRLIRRAERLGFVVHEVGEFSRSLVEEVNRLHLMTRESYRITTDLDADSWNEALGILFRANLARLLTVSDSDGVMVAFVLLTNTHPESTLVATGADPSRLDSGAGALLRWRMLSESSASGVEFVDLNGARFGPEGRFKASFGGELVDRWELTSPPRPVAFDSSLNSPRTRLRVAARALLGR